MANISVIGGGRWARTIAGVLLELDGGCHGVRLHCRHSAARVEEWIAQKNLAGRIDVAPDGPDFAAIRPDAVIVANRAADHAAAAILALDAGIPVLVEKPMVIGAESMRHLRHRAEASGAMLAASHVVLFARYADTFAAMIEAAGGAQQMEMIWQDGDGDVIRGEVKSYDPAVSVFDDVLPHICPLLNRVAPGPQALAGLNVARGGAEIVMQLKTDSLPVRLYLGRDTGGRCRKLTVQTGQGVFVLDFTREPGLISKPGGESVSGDPLWDREPRPLRAMLSAFLAASRNGRLDERLSPLKALTTAILTDEVRAQYVPLQSRWLTEQGQSSPPGQEYAVREMALRAGENGDGSTGGHRKEP